MSNIFTITRNNNYKKITFLNINLYERFYIPKGFVKYIIRFPLNLYLYKSLTIPHGKKIYICGIQIFFKRKKDYQQKNFKKNHTEINEMYKNFVDFLYRQNSNRSTNFVPITQTPYERKTTDTKIIAYYLPQYHKIAVNDKFHGKGFTEWTRSSQAIPMFYGHEQPHIPYDVGYYDLMNPDTLKRQAELANMYGIYGFCMHWYWFSGSRIMEKPLELLLAHPEIDIRYCFNWATENWTALWDGGNKEVMFIQHLNDKDDYELFCDLLPYFNDPRYIRIENKPLFSIYNIRIFEKERAKLLVSNLKKFAKAAGFDGLYITTTDFNKFNEDVSEWNLDALNQFPPSYLTVKPFEPEGFIYPQFKGNIYDCKDLIKNKSYLRTYQSKTVYRSAMVSFDNTARKAYSDACHIFHGLNPSTFHTWLSDIVAESKKVHDPEHDICFINSWNEWAEGSHLEPCIRYGYAYLQAVKDVLESSRPIDTEIIYRQIAAIDQNEKLNIYIHCIESFGDIVACEPLTRHLKENFKECTIHWILKKEYYRLVQFNPYIDNIIMVNCLSDSIDICDNKRVEKNNIIIDCHYDGRICSHTKRIHSNKNNSIINEKTYFNYGGILENFCLTAGLPPLDVQPIFWQKENIEIPYNLPSKYIVLHCKSSEKIKDWTDENWNSLSTLLLKKGFNIVEIGIQKTIYSNNKHYTDLTNINDFQSLAEIIKRSNLFCSIDSGFAHIANCFNVPSCILMGKYKSFDYYMPYTGFLKSNDDKYIIHSEKSASFINVNDVYLKIIELTSQI